MKVIFVDQSKTKQYIRQFFGFRQIYLLIGELTAYEGVNRFVKESTTVTITCGWLVGWLVGSKVSMHLKRAPTTHQPPLA